MGWLLKLTYTIKFLGESTIDEPKTKERMMVAEDNRKYSITVFTCFKSLEGKQIMQKNLSFY